MFHRPSKHLKVRQNRVRKTAVCSSGTSRFSCLASNFSLSLVRRARAQTSCLLTEYKKSTKTCPGQAKFENRLSEGQARFTFFRALVKNTPLRVVFSTLSSVFGYPDETLFLAFSRLIYCTQHENDPHHVRTPAFKMFSNQIDGCMLSSSLLMCSHLTSIHSVG